MTSFSFLAALTLAGGSTGCSKKGPECEQTVTTLNPGVDALNKAMAMPEEKPEQAVAQGQAVAKAADNANAAFSKLSPTTPELQSFVTDYKALLGDVSKAAKDQESAAKADIEIHSKVEALNKAEHAAEEKLSKTCEEPDLKADERAECNGLMKVVEGSPKDLEDAEKLKKFAADLKKSDPKRAKTKAAMAELSTAYDGWIKVVADVKAAEAKLRAAEDVEAAALKKQNASVDTLNKFCTAS